MKTKRDILFERAYLKYKEDAGEGYVSFDSFISDDISIEYVKAEEEEYLVEVTDRINRGQLNGDYR